MNTIQEAIDSGACTHLGPITVDKDYGTGTNPRSPRRVMVRDKSGKTLLKLWGNARTANFTDGDTIEVRAIGDKGIIETQQDQQGRNELSANNVIVEVVGAGNKAVARAQSRPAGKAAASRGPVASMKQLIDYGLACVGYAQKKSASMNIEFTGELANSVFGSAMYGFKEGRALTPAPAEDPPPQEEAPPQQKVVRTPITPVTVIIPDAVEEDDDIPF